MADTHSIILRKTDPFLLDETAENLENISPNSSKNSSYGCLPLGSNPGGSGEEDRPFLETNFNRVDANKYRKPGDASAFSSSEKELLEFEQTANEVWDAYRQLYYGHDAIGSVYIQRKVGSSSATSTPSKTKKSGALEALFGIQKTCQGDDGETARWDSVHTVTIEVPNLQERTCEYKIRSAVWCRYKPEDVGDVPRAERPKPAATKKSPTKKAAAKSKLDIARLEVFDRAANQWDSNKGPEPSSSPKAGKVLNSAPVPAVVTSSAVYTKDTTKVCKLQSFGGSPKKAASSGIPISSHIENIGSLIEKIESDLRSKFERVDAPKCIEVLQGMYRPSLSPGLKLPSAGSSNGSMISKLGGHATGMGVGKCMIGEIALKAKSKGLGDGGSATNKALEGILANEKKKLVDGGSSSPSQAPDYRGRLKKSNSLNAGPKKDASRMPRPGFKKPNLRKAVSVRGNFESSSSTTSATPEFMNFRSKLKSTAAK